MSGGMWNETQFEAPSLGKLFWAALASAASRRGVMVVTPSIFWKAAARTARSAAACARRCSVYRLPPSSASAAKASRPIMASASSTIAWPASFRREVFSIWVIALLIMGWVSRPSGHGLRHDHGDRFSPQFNALPANDGAHQGGDDVVLVRDGHGERLAGRGVRRFDCDVHRVPVDQPAARGRVADPVLDIVGGSAAVVG